MYLYVALSLMAIVPLPYIHVLYSQVYNKKVDMTPKAFMTANDFGTPLVSFSMVLIYKNVQFS